jgi:ornithine cyclodeaminase
MAHTAAPGNAPVAAGGKQMHAGEPADTMRNCHAIKACLEIAVMILVDEPTIRQSMDYPQVIRLMREALIAHSSGACHTPPPMHLDIAPASAEVHIKSSYRSGGKFYVLKMASSFPGNVAKGKSSGNGLMLLCSAATGEPAALLTDGGHLTDVRTAAVAAMLAAELNRQDRRIGILGSGIQARMQAIMHAHVLPLNEVCLWGRTAGRLQQCAADIQRALPQVNVCICSTPAEAAALSKLVICCTASRAPLLQLRDLQPGTLVSAVGSDAPGKQELDPEILRAAALLLVDSRSQCLRLGELQHLPGLAEQALEIGDFCMAPRPVGAGSITVADFTGLGVEDLYIAEHCLAQAIH